MYDVVTCIVGVVGAHIDYDNLHEHMITHMRDSVQQSTEPQPRTLYLLATDTANITSECQHCEPAHGNKLKHGTPVNRPRASPYTCVSIRTRPRPVVMVRITCHTHIHDKCEYLEPTSQTNKPSYDMYFIPRTYHHH